jgi:hypothetical protein
MKTLFGILVPLLAIAAPAMADDPERLTFGGDQYVAGQQAIISNSVERDAFAAGFNVVLSKSVSGDAHAGGFTVDISGPVSGDIYAVGNTVTISGPVGQDVTAASSSITLSGSDPIDGNLRAAAGSIVLDRPVSGSALMAGAGLTINAPIVGNAVLAGDSVNFGENARIDGRVEIRAAEEIEVPARVAPADRVTFTKVESGNVANDAGNVFKFIMKDKVDNWFVPVLGALAVIIYGTILLALFPRRAETGYLTAMTKPISSLGFGGLALAAFIGLIPVLAMTLIGIPLVPVAVVFLVLAALTGYIAGAYFLSDRVLGAFNYDTNTLWKRVGALVIGLVAVWILGIIPFIGWLVQLGLALFGLGALCFSAFGRRIDSDFHRQLAKDTGLTT